ncbi:hypothetical protein KSS87_011343 [Heliosperma pusillum]|nr:hypothetical protein KSS87_011343 [Heliosperma pusillum]
MFSVGNSITDDILQEYLEYTASLLVNKTADTLDTTTTSKTANGRLGDALDVIPQDLPVPLCSSLSQTLTSLPSS